MYKILFQATVLIFLRMYPVLFHCQWYMDGTGNIQLVWYMDGSGNIPLLYHYFNGTVPLEYRNLVQLEDWNLVQLEDWNLVPLEYWSLVPVKGIELFVLNQGISTPFEASQSYSYKQNTQWIHHFHFYSFLSPC